ncbi:nickel-binding protein [Allomuricauda sp. SCSIO 65647]|uniref:nickel-binding protein n=1 Tax=Allomuricauda sp. SCSIO 65647 TaxID=2908843 RepID=UPI001F1F7016|nr:nickel-binding protein [Muricauda sp. SCSIO 65647]UJH68360.1 DUF4242 domain-containing protein [Muricauda sp. SCSIO 65647]
MDFHKIEDDAFTEEDAYKGHLRDVAVQNKHGLVYKRYYLNLEQGAIFCLMESPNRKACVESHKEAHGVGACNVIEVSTENEFLPFMGEGLQNEQDLALTLSGDIDSGYRTLVLVDIVDFSKNSEAWKSKLIAIVKKNKGSIVKLPKQSIMTSFIDAHDAVVCALEIHIMLKALEGKLEFSFGIATGKPVDEHSNDLFGETKKVVRVLSRLGNNGKIFIDLPTKNTVELTNKKVSTDSDVVVFFDDSGYSVLERLDKILESNFNDASFKTENFRQEFGLSKTQLHRKMQALTGLSPNKILTEFRLKKAIRALKTGEKTVAEVAYDCGFNSPTYFTRVFRKRFDVLPNVFGKAAR